MKLIHTSLILLEVDVLLCNTPLSVLNYTQCLSKRVVTNPNNIFSIIIMHSNDMILYTPCARYSTWNIWSHSNSFIFNNVTCSISTPACNIYFFNKGKNSKSHALTSYMLCVV